MYETENSTSTTVTMTSSTFTTSLTSPGSTSGLANTVTEPSTASPPKKRKGKHLNMARENKAMVNKTRCYCIWNSDI